MQIESLFDVPPSEQTTKEWSVDLPLDEQPWNVGLIVGPSGAGKTRVAEALFGKLDAQHSWTDAALVDDFADTMTIHQVTGLLTAVGLGSVPTWLRPHSTLSNGEQFRADVARALAESGSGEIVVIDEFTSVVDRQVAQVASHAIQKQIRRDDRRFIAVSCHHDIVDWLQPDWTYEPATDEFTWRSVQPRPRVELRIDKASHHAWRIFRDHHYMSADLAKASQCFVATVDERPVAFTSYLHFPHSKTKNIKMGHRLVVLPDWQGLGIGGRLDDWLGELLHSQGYRYRNVVAHPAMVNFYARSPRWRCMSRPKRAVTSGQTGVASMRERQTSTRTLSTFSFEYAPKS